jgi:hypothetical protein
VPLREGFLRFLRLPSRFQVYGLKITSQDWLKNSPGVVEIKPHQQKAALHSL